MTSPAAYDLSSLHEAQDPTQEWCGQTQWNNSRLVVAHDPVAAARRTVARDKTIAELIDIGQQCSVKLDAHDESQRIGKKNKTKGRPMSDSGTKARFYHAVKDAHMAHVIKVDLKAELFSYSIDEDKKRYLELLDGKLLLVTNTNEAAAVVVQRYKSLADIERGFPAKSVNCSAVGVNRLKASTSAASSQFHLLIVNSPYWSGS